MTAVVDGDGKGKVGCDVLEVALVGPVVDSAGLVPPTDAAVSEESARGFSTL